MTDAFQDIMARTVLKHVQQSVSKLNARGTIVIVSTAVMETSPEAIVVTVHLECTDKTVIRNVLKIATCHVTVLLIVSKTSATKKTVLVLMGVPPATQAICAV